MTAISAPSTTKTAVVPDHSTFFEVLLILMTETSNYLSLSISSLPAKLYTPFTEFRELLNEQQFAESKVESISRESRSLFLAPFVNY